MYITCQICYVIYATHFLKYCKNRHLHIFFSTSWMTNMYIYIRCMYNILDIIIYVHIWSNMNTHIKLKLVYLNVYVHICTPNGWGENLYIMYMQAVIFAIFVNTCCICDILYMWNLDMNLYVISVICIYRQISLQLNVVFIIYFHN